MADILPTALFTGWTEDGTDITLPLADLPGLTAAEADAASGDGREIVRIFLNTVFTKIQALPSADRPSKMTITRGNPTGVSASEIRQSYTVTFDLAISPVNVEMSDEPA